MLTIKVLGPGCPNCQKVEAHTQQALDMLQPQGGYELTKVKDPVEISAYILSTPGLVSVAIFSFVFSWNEFLYALMLTNFDAITMPVLIAGQNNTRGIEWWFISALTLFAVIPVILVGLFLERYITRGLTAGALKG